MGSTRFDAFISYSHRADDRLAPTLQRGLHTLGKPWNKRRALEVFRDRTGLSVSPHLWGSIVTALDNSTWFILLASPDSARSDWVGKEIEHWLHRSPDAAQRLLPVVTDGTWHWDHTTNTLSPDSTAAHPALHNAFTDEPLHLDLTWLHDQHVDLDDPRFRDALAELAAPLHGIPKDELISEDIRQHKRAIRLRRTATTALAALTIGAVTASVIAVNQTNTAQQRRIEADQARTTAEQRRIEADEQRTIAEQQRTQAETNAALSRSRELAALAVNRMVDEPQFAAALAIDALYPVGETSEFTTDDARSATGITGRHLLSDPMRRTALLPADGVIVIAASPDGTQLALATSDEISVVDLGSGTVTDSTRVPYVPDEMLFSDDAASISYRLDATSGRTWDLASGEVSRTRGTHRVLGRRAWASRMADRTWQIVPVGSARASHVGLTDRPVALRPDGSLLLDDGGRLVDEAEQVPTDQSVDLLLDVSATGDVLLDRPVVDLGASDRTLAIHPVDGTPVVLDRAPPGLRSAAFSPDGRYVLALGRTADVADDVLVSTTWTGTLWDAMTGDVLSRFERQGALTAAWLDDAAFAVLEGADTLTTYEVIATDFGPAVTAAAASGALVTASVAATPFDEPGRVDIDVRMSTVDDAARVGEITTAPGSAPRPDQLVVSDDGRYAFFHGSLVDLATGDVTALVDPDSSDTTLAAAAFLPDGETIAVALGEGVTLHDTTTGSVIGQLPLVGRYAASIAAFPDGVRLAVGASPQTPDDDAALFVVDLTTRRWTLVADEHPTSDIAIIDDAQMIVGTYPDTVTVWDTSTPTPTVVREFTPSVGLVGNLSVSDDGRRLLVSGTAGARFQAQIWDVERAVLVERLDSLLVVSARDWSGVTFVGDGLLALYGGDGLALLPDVAPDVVCAAISEEVLDEVEAFTGNAAACRRLAP